MDLTNLNIMNQVKWIDDFEMKSDEKILELTSRNSNNSLGPASWDYSLKMLSDHQRISLLTTVIILLILALLGNFATILTINKKKHRPIFKACLISLAVSDLLTVIFISTSYIAQLSDEISVIWSLGGMMCAFIPFVTTMAILANSMTLVGIALDRYFAVIRIVKGPWEPGRTFCVAGTILLWGLAAGISSPMLTSYTIFDVYVIITSHPISPPTILGLEQFQVCAGEKSENAYYFGIVFGAVFFPLFLAFCWLNFTIAKEIYNRRDPIQSRGNHTAEQTSRTETDDTSMEKGTSETNTVSHISNGKLSRCNSAALEKIKPDHIQKVHAVKDNRKKRQMRMFKVIVLIILIFFLLRLPTWIFLLMKLNMTLTENIHWILQYVFGILSLTNCVVNPFIYTFLSETIHYGNKFSEKIKTCCFPWIGCICICKKNEYTDAEIGSRDDSSSAESKIRNDRRISPAGNSEGVYCIDK